MTGAPISGGTTPLGPSEVVRIESLSKSFGKLAVLRGIDLAVREHEVVCLIGASGSGKSTLLRCINLLEPIDAGRILMDGADIRVTRPSAMRPSCWPASDWPTSATSTPTGCRAVSSSGWRSSGPWRCTRS